MKMNETKLMVASSDQDLTEDMLLTSIREGDFIKAVQELDNRANSFGFFRTATVLVDALMSKGSQQADLFAKIWVSGLVSLRDQVDGRNQKAIDTAIKLREAGYEANPDNFNSIVSTMRRMHRTVLQQASVLPFMIIDRIDGKPDFAEFNDWYKMPLI